MANISSEPMDIDLSANSVTYMDVSFNEKPCLESPVRVTQEIDLTSESNSPMNANCTKTYHGPEEIPLPKQAAGVKVYHIVKKNNEKPYFTSTHIIISFIIVACISILAYQVINVHCSSELDPYYLNEKLHRRVYGQYMAVTDVVNSLKTESKTKILFFYGGIGVGKTYTVSLMFEDKWNYTNVYHYTMPSFLTTFTTDLMLGLTMCPTAYFVLDDLAPGDLTVIRSHIVDVVQKNEEHNKNMVIILVFNCDNTDKDFLRKCDNSFHKELTESFNNIKALKQVVRFDELREHHLRKCIEDEFEGPVDEDQLDKILKSFNVSLDGCKGVHKKIKFMSNI